MTFFILVRMFYHWGATLDIIALAAMVAPYEHFNFIYVVPNRGGGYSWEFLLGVWPKNVIFQTSKIHTRFQTWPLGRNYVIIT